MTIKKITINFYRMAPWSDSSSMTLYYLISGELKPPKAIKAKIEQNFLKDLAEAWSKDNQDRSITMSHPFMHRFLRVEASNRIDSSENMLLFYDGYRPVIKVFVEKEKLRRLAHLQQRIADPNLLVLTNSDQNQAAGKLILKQTVEVQLTNWREAKTGIFLADARAAEISSSQKSGSQSPQ